MVLDLREVASNEARKPTWDFQDLTHRTDLCKEGPPSRAILSCCGLSGCRRRAPPFPPRQSREWDKGPVNIVHKVPESRIFASPRCYPSVLPLQRERITDKWRALAAFQCNFIYKKGLHRVWPAACLPQASFMNTYHLGNLLKCCLRFPTTPGGGEICISKKLSGGGGAPAGRGPHSTTEGLDKISFFWIHFAIAGNRWGGRCGLQRAAQLHRISETPEEPCVNSRASRGNDAWRWMPSEQAAPGELGVLASPSFSGLRFGAVPWESM